MDKNFWIEAFKQFGISVIFAVMLAVFYTNENAKWEKSQAVENTRWETLFQKYTDEQRQAMEAIRACCMEHHGRIK